MPGGGGGGTCGCCSLLPLFLGEPPILGAFTRSDVKEDKEEDDDEVGVAEELLLGELLLAFLWLLKLLEVPSEAEVECCCF